MFPLFKCHFAGVAADTGQAAAARRGAASSRWQEAAKTGCLRENRTVVGKHFCINGKMVIFLSDVAAAKTGTSRLSRAFSERWERVRPPSWVLGGMWNNQVCEDACGFIYGSLILQRKDKFAACLDSMLGLYLFIFLSNLNCYWFKAKDVILEGGMRPDPSLRCCLVKKQKKTTKKTFHTVAETFSQVL